MQVGANNERCFFLLGGSDLEMQTIRSLLDEREVGYADHGLRWDNANLSAYREELALHRAGDWVVYGIELHEDMEPPLNYKIIDHHNSRETEPCALEQVMELLRIPSNRHLRLVAANDKAYIPGMMDLEATPEEIEQIRRADRQAQGVTGEEERLAEKAIAENCTQLGSLVVVNALCSRFAPICDRLFPYRSLLVYTEREWMFYGKGVEQVRALFPEAIQTGNLFFGGGRNGYAGVAQGAFSAGEIREMVDRIKEQFI